MAKVGFKWYEYLVVVEVARARERPAAHTSFLKDERKKYVCTFLGTCIIFLLCIISSYHNFVDVKEWSFLFLVVFSYMEKKQQGVRDDAIIEQFLDCFAESRNLFFKWMYVVYAFYFFYWGWGNHALNNVCVWFFNCFFKNPVHM